MLPIKQGQAAIAAVCVILGIMLAVQFRTTQDIKASVPYQRVEDLSQKLSKAEKERDALLSEVHALRNASANEAFARELQHVKMKAGLIPLQGPGVTVVIDDSKRPTKPGENPNLYLIHDDDILKVINELRAAGAEAISINGQRLVANSEIRCAGPTLSVNNSRYSPPYEISVIGDPQTLESSLKLRGGVVETLQFWGIQVTVKRQDTVKVPAYKGSFTFQYAKPIEEDKKQ
ncbi:DUF881 domain-containing protein [Anaeroselena agilis]|uniref:DUF881 domain-containing protein n=1 Tax=Anaeroselena agilis TaxID=3063788 RepID=A0ABU3NY00_9FIRM|nr:DUF881 domain-containing protein [Selenomonadales bacterium 4137-cl]